MRGEFGEILGKTIAGVVIKERDGVPRYQLFIIFSDGTHYEIYGEQFRGAGGVDRGGRDAVIRYMPDGKIVFDEHQPQ